MGRPIADIEADIAALRAEAEESSTSRADRIIALVEERNAAAVATYGAITCPRRREGGPQRAGADWWQPQPNGERACSFCGCMHPEDFDRFLDRVISDESVHVRVDVSDKPWKLYAHRPEVENAAAGPIKFYTMHAPADWFPAGSPAQAKLARADERSRAKWREWIASQRTPIPVTPAVPERPDGSTDES